MMYIDPTHDILYYNVMSLGECKKMKPLVDAKIAALQG